MFEIIHQCADRSTYNFNNSLDLFPWMLRNDVKREGLFLQAVSSWGELTKSKPFKHELTFFEHVRKTWKHFEKRG